MFEVEYRSRINRLADFIERNLDKPLTLSELSKEAGISQFHLHRLFLTYTGETVSAFIRRNRLASGFKDIRKAKSPSVVDAALSAGYESVSSFIRAFRTRFGFTPGSTPQSGINSLSFWRLQKSEAQKTVVEPLRVELRPRLILAGVMERGYQGRSFKAAAERAFARLLAVANENKIHDKLGRACAAMFDDPDLSEPFETRYFGAFEWLAAQPPVYEGLDHLVMPEGLHAVFAHRGSYRTLWQTWNAAYRNWLPHSQYDLRDSPPFEIYITDPRTVRNEHELMTEIYIPIDRRLM